MAEMTKMEMAKIIARMSEELEALKASVKEQKPEAKKPQTSPKGKKTPAMTTEKVVMVKTSPKGKVVLPVRKGKTVNFDGWLNYKVWVFNKPKMIELGGEYDKTTRSILFPSAKAATAFCAGFVPTLSEAQYADQRQKIADGFEARRAEKAAASEADGKASKKPSAKKADLIRKGKSSNKAESSAPVKKPEWKERAHKGEKPFANYSTYKEYWHAMIGK